MGIRIRIPNTVFEKTQDWGDKTAVALILSPSEQRQSLLPPAHHDEEPVRQPLGIAFYEFNLSTVPLPRCVR